ncbi:ABC transporter ATP-binding protein [Streptosporangium canum]|uniref:ABC transporter ATP-binding protein n=1 Tax=Streptosporangium canum TaxID=324952 RepID=UPI00368CD1D3
MIVIALLSATIPVASSWLTKLIIDRLTVGDTLVQVLDLAAGLSVLGLMLSASSSVRRYVKAELSRRISLLAQDNLYRAINALPGLSKFENPIFLNKLRMATQAGGTTPSQIGEAGLSLAGGIITISGFLCSLAVISPVMAGIVLIGAAPALMAEIALSKRRTATAWKLSPIERREIFYTHLLSSVEAAKEVRLFGLGDFLHDRMLSERRNANTEKRRVDRQELSAQAGLGLIAALVSGGGLIWAVAQARNGAMTVGDVSMFVTAVAGVQMSLSGVVTQTAVAHQQLSLFQHYQAVVSTPSDLPIRSGHLPSLVKGIEIRDVWFRYGPDHPWILKGVNLTIPYGSSVGLVGLNGAGKSTLIKLLCRFYDPTEGIILWDGLDLREITPAGLRDRISAVFQDYMNYDMTVSENIGMGDLSRFADQSMIEEAARHAGAHEMIATLPKGYDTLITRIFSQEEDESEGVFLSGGQEQRVAIARAMLREDRDLLILDEPSSGLDARAENEMHTRLKKYRDGRTSLLISHRLGAVREADIIAVLNEGHIVEQGSHEGLMRFDGVYAQLFNLQASGYQEKERGKWC